MEQQFRYKSLLEKRKMALDELCAYYCEQRKYEFDKGMPIKGLEMHDRLHKLVVALLKIDRFFARENIEILSDERIPSSRPKVFACTHIGGNDIQRVFEILGEQAYLFLGDPGDTYRNVAGVLIDMNGSVKLETRDKIDRKISYKRGVELLNKGKNIVIFPEGAWNVYENLPIMGLYTGAVRMAIETGADIVPIALEQYGKKFKIKIGKNIPTYKNMNVYTANEHLRDVLGTLKYEIWESEPMMERDLSVMPMKWEGVSVLEQERLIKKYYEPFRESIVHKEELGYVLQDVYDTMYRRNETTADSLIAEIQERLSKGKRATYFKEGDYEMADRLEKEYNEEVEQKQKVMNFKPKDQK